MEHVEQKKGRLMESYDILPYKWYSDEKPQKTLMPPDKLLAPQIRGIQKLKIGKEDTCKNI